MITIYRQCGPRLTDNRPQVPEDLAMILNDSTLFSNSADITTKEILKRYGDRAKAPQVSSSPLPATHQHHSNPSNDNAASAAQRVDTDPNMATAWQNESSVRHVGSDRDMAGAPNLPYATAQGRNSSESHGSPNRGSMRPSQRAMAV